MMPDYWLDQCREFLQCFDTVALVTAKASSTSKRVPLIHQRFSSRTSGERNQGSGIGQPRLIWKTAVKMVIVVDKREIKILLVITEISRGVVV